MIVIELDMVTASHNRLGIIRTFRQFIEPTQAQPGCLHCRLLEDNKGEQSLVYQEAWNSESDLLRRIRSTQFKKVLAVMEMARRPPKFRIQTISEIRGLETIEKLRKPLTEQGGSQKDLFRRRSANHE